VEAAAAMMMILAALATAGPIGAQTPTTAAPSIYHLKLQARPDVPVGQAGGARRTTGPQGDRIVVENMSILRPVAVAIVADDASRAVVVSLVKGNWNEPERSQTTDSQGVALMRLRTEGNFGIHVRPADGGPVRYSLVVWAGDEMPREPEPVLVAAGDVASRRGGIGSRGLLAVAGVGIVVLAGAGVWIARRGRKTAVEVRHV
jgi:hypothetical protein